MNHYPLKISNTWLGIFALFLVSSGLLPAQEGVKTKPDAKPQAKQEAKPIH